MKTNTIIITIIVVLAVVAYGLALHAHDVRSEASIESMQYWGG